MNLENMMEEKLKRARQELDSDVRIALLGQPGAGKSSLINKLIGKRLFEVDVRTDTTVDMSEAKFGDLKIVDLPGYGTRMFPVDEWVEKFHPEEYDIYLFVFDGKLHESDAELFDYLKKWQSERSHPHFIVRNKLEQIWDEEKTLDELKSVIEKDVRDKMRDNTSAVYFVSCRQKIGLDTLKKAIFAADIHRVKKEKLKAYFVATTKDDLEDKKQICKGKVDNYALLGAANAINPIPGVDMGLDLTIYFNMLSDIRKVFGIDEDLEAKVQKYQALAPVAKKVLDMATKEGIKVAAKQFISKETEKTLAKYIPIIGQAFSACAGYGMMQYAGNSYVDDCYTLAEAFLDSKASEL